MIDGLPNLERVRIGDNSFQQSTSADFSNVFSISNCPKLMELIIGNNCFVSYTLFDISNLHSMVNVSIGSNSLVSVNTVLANGLEKLSEMKIGEESLKSIQKYNHFLVVNNIDLKSMIYQY